LNSRLPQPVEIQQRSTYTLTFSDLPCIAKPRRGQMSTAHHDRCRRSSLING
jgi:hypothetical protein